ncbi:tagatose 6-phosphate kinase [Lentibacillus halodurans]|uniref:Tagatose-6-phosphate kinase n=1 Tax=Lentibacillus halodurans TaxID=237679 RepID=A0A1I0YH02_9BACI|nr:hexose kinase [Lentibacillus halodurans]SFB12649.1 tagatose 6-phosphate kinase [Lentibacillus halodurans]
MILTVTLNPSVDISYKLNHFSLDSVNRVADVTKTAGGKGLNVARVLKQLGEEVASSGFLGGSLGGFIRRGISKLGIHDYFVHIEGETRNCIAVIHEGQQTEMLESGPQVDKDEVSQFLDEFSEYVQKVDIVTISGSLPKGLDNDFYVQLVKLANEYETPLLLDTKGELLEQTLAFEHKPFLIKPNREELEDLIGEKINDEAQMVAALTTQRFTNVPWVVVTAGDSGAIVKHSQGIYRVTTPKVDAVNPVGSGDAVIAGFASGLSHKLDDERLIKYGLAMGVLNAMEAKTGSINPAKISWCMDQIFVEKVLIS